ncbi:unnamed protein product [Chrysoparadoxa australica]
MMSDSLFKPRAMIDLRSDTIAQPTKDMRKVMSNAKVGDDVFGEDPTINQLQEQTALLLGKEAGLFVPTGCMANLICELTWCSQRGSEMICGDQSHVYLWEQANAAQLGGIGYRPLRNQRDGTMDLDEIAAAVRGSNVHCPVTRLMTLENTHNQCGGRVLTTDYVDAVGDIAHSRGVKLHMDGARIWNAAAALGESPARMVEACDTVSVCFSKGLAAPVGSMILGSEDFIGRARRTRKALGGGMRQAGFLAAAAAEGLKKMLPRIGEDHAVAKKLALGLATVQEEWPGWLSIDVSTVETNILLMDLGTELRGRGVTAQAFVDRLVNKGVLAVAMTTWSVRFVTHYQISEQDAGKVMSAIRAVLDEVESSKPPAPPAKLPTASVVPSWEENKAAASKAEDAFDMHETLGEDGAVRGPIQDSIPSGDPTAAAGAVYQSDVNVQDVEIVEQEPAVAPEVQQAQAYYEEVEVSGVTVSDEGFIAILQSTHSPRALKIPITPADPLSTGLDKHEADTPEAITLLQLMQGIDVGAILPRDSICTKITCPVGGGTPEVTEIRIHEVRASRGGVGATLLATMTGEGEAGSALGTQDCSLNCGFEVIAQALRSPGATLSVAPSLLSPSTEEDEESPSFDSELIERMYPKLVRKLAEEDRGGEVEEELGEEDTRNQKYFEEFAAGVDTTMASWE